MKKILFAFTVFSILLAACAPQSFATATTLPTATATATETPAPTLTPTEIATPTPQPSEQFDAATWAGMSAADKAKAIDALPATSPDGYTKGNESTVKDNLVIYRDASGKAVGAYDLLTGKMETMQAAGIIEFDMTDGGKYEMRYYATVKDWLDAVSGSQGDVLWRTDNREQAVNMFLMDTDSRSIAWGKEIQKIVGRNVHSGIIVAYPPSGSKFFVIGTTEVGRGTAAMVRGQDKAYRADYVDAPIGEVDAAIVPAGQNATP